MVQCKRYGPGNNVGSPDMQRFLGTLHHFRAERGLFVTTAGFTPQARDFAGQHGIELIDGPGLARFGERAASGHAPMAGGRRVAVGAGLLGLLALAMAVDRGVEPEAPAPTPVVAARPIVTRSPTRPPARPASATATNLPLPVLQARTVVAPSMTEAARPTAAPRPTASPRPTVIPPPTATPRPTLTLRPVQRAVRATATPRPTATTRPSTTPRAKATARPTRPPVVRSSRRGGATATAGPGRLGLAAVPEGIPKEATRARIGEVTDGDTVVVEVGGRTEPVRLIGIDAPEARDSNDPAECFGAEATARTARMLPPGREVWLERDVSDRDRYDRLLRYVWFVSREDGGARLANQILVQEGFAVASTYQPDSRYAGRFASAQGAARALGRGLWEACGGADTPVGEAAPEPTARATRTPEPTPRPRASRPTPIPAAIETEKRVFPGEEEPASAAGGAGCDPSYPGLCLPSFRDLD